MTTPVPSARLHADELAGLRPLSGCTILDVGCGGGGFLQELLRHGADAIGLETDEGQLARARAAGIDASRLRIGRAGALPFPDASLDVVCCIFTLHHFAPDEQMRAFDEAARTLRPGGGLFVVEPTPHGPMSEVLKPLEDETEVRTRSIALLEDGAVAGLARRARRPYEVTRTVSGPDELIRTMIDVDPARAGRAADPAVRDAVRQRFETHAETLDGGVRLLRQPCIAFFFERA
ncbi:class I SAM-dependent methyltransferase [Acidisphaera rubrifaciens]|uniref:S-adenosylmethionine-dependent methyltransferases n=1 Tax=Acidisphaera rubrifaciens HS-AP3 TaxID=1231350 RepID=A0A0D6PA43_9PROT|nr:class I SAM-dependent methyltransferase [Acidisphaera rubrifaciens]GAN77734.1 S-adenosylmethionine-dependent methyltransferases [Acidisphaera rubrifaciens HS-AP3]